MLAIAVAAVVLALPGCGQVMLAHELNALNARFENRLQWTTESLPVLAAGQPYAGRLTAAGGVPPYHWEITQGELPRGLTLDGSRGIISGVPVGAFEQAVIVQLTDSSGDSNAYVLGSIHPDTAGIEP